MDCLRRANGAVHSKGCSLPHQVQQEQAHQTRQVLPAMIVGDTTGGPCGMGSSVGRSPLRKDPHSCKDEAGLSGDGDRYAVAMGYLPGDVRVAPATAERTKHRNISRNTYCHLSVSIIRPTRRNASTHPGGFDNKCTNCSHTHVTVEPPYRENIAKPGYGTRHMNTH